MGVGRAAWRACGGCVFSVGKMNLLRVLGGADVGEVKPADAVRHLRSFCTHRVVIANSGTLRGEDAVRGRRHLLIPGGESSGGPRSLAAGGAECSYYETMVLNLTRFQ